MLWSLKHSPRQTASGWFDAAAGYNSMWLLYSQLDSLTSIYTFLDDHAHKSTSHSAELSTFDQRFQKAIQLSGRERKWRVLDP